MKDRTQLLLRREGFVARFALYLALVGLWFHLIVWLVPRHGWERIAAEGGFIERSQVIILFVACLLLVRMAVNHVESRGLNIMLAALTGLAVLREFNNTPIYEAIFLQKWMNWAFAGVVLGTVGCCFRRVLPTQARRLCGRPAFLLYLLGSFLCLLWAQTLAQKELWDPLYDRLMEETLELAGYIMIVCGVVEDSIFFSGHAQPEPDSKPLLQAEKT